ncbi:lipoprotein [Polaromonas vacuolata]|uniref:lipoprotein n=1 Tax=Polaromonas vacuolata TaxID=37448 RepID=UPI003B51D1F8
MVFSIQILGCQPSAPLRQGLVALASLIGLCSLVGCGQTGPLFLPVLPPATATAITTLPTSKASSATPIAITQPSIAASAPQ